MAQEEMYGDRDLTYSAWHRRGSTGRFIGIEDAQLLAMIDLDVALYVEYDDGTKEPVLLIEVARDVAQDNKPSTVTRLLAERADLPAYVVLYRVSEEEPNPASPELPDIEGFRVKRIWPSTEYTWRKLTPQEYAEGLLRVRRWQGKRIDKDVFGVTMRDSL